LLAISSTRSGGSPVGLAHGVVALEQLAPACSKREIDPVAQLRARLPRHPEQHADRLERQLARDVDHEIATASAHRVGDDRARPPAQLRLEAPDPARREALVHE
jgi:hypothetical protein